MCLCGCGLFDSKHMKNQKTPGQWWCNQNDSRTELNDWMNIFCFSDKTCNCRKSDMSEGVKIAIFHYFLTPIAKKMNTLVENINLVAVVVVSWIPILLLHVNLVKLRTKKTPLAEKSKLKKQWFWLAVVGALSELPLTYSVCMYECCLPSHAHYMCTVTNLQLCAPFRLLAPLVSASGVRRNNEGLSKKA